MPIVPMTPESQKMMNSQGPQMISLTRPRKRKLTDQQIKAIEYEIRQGYTPEEARRIVLEM